MKQPEVIPEALRERPQWVLWRREERDGKATKVPHRADDPNRHASATDPATWAPFEAVLAAVRDGRGDGLGYVFASDDPFAGIDLDHCLDADGEPHPDAAGIVAELDSYTERSPSGAGLHVLIRAELNGGRNRTGKTPWGGEFEAYDRGRYFTVTGERLSSRPASIEPRQSQLDSLLARIFPPPSRNGHPSPVAPVPAGDQELLRRAFAARNGSKVEALYRGKWESDYPSQSEADCALCNALAFWSGGDSDRIDRLFRSSGLMREKWDEPRGETTYGAQTIAKSLEGRTEFFDWSRHSEPVPELRQPQNAVDAVGESQQEEGANCVTASPYRERSYDAVAPVDAESLTQCADAVDSAPFAVPLAEFIAERSNAPVALIGDEAEVILPTAGFLLLFGKGGKGKTTMVVDLALHLAAGRDWLDFEVPRPLRVLFIENEGPREPFRAKLEAKLEHWRDELPGELFIHRLNWGAFTFTDPKQVVALTTFVQEAEVDVVIGDPLDSLGVEGVGSPEDTRRFMELMGRVGLFQTVAFILLHHPRKEGAAEELDEAAGAWGGKPDTVLRLIRQEHNRSRLSFPKVRWSRRGTRPAYILAFDPESETFTVAHEEEDEERDYLAEVRELLGDGQPRTVKEIAMPTKSGGIGASERQVSDELAGHPELFSSHSGDAAKALGRSARATLWTPADAGADQLAALGLEPYDEEAG